MDQRKNPGRAAIRVECASLVLLAVDLALCTPAHPPERSVTPLSPAASAIILQHVHYSPRDKMLLGVAFNAGHVGLSNCRVDIRIGGKTLAAWVSGGISPGGRAFLQSPYPPRDVTDSLGSAAGAVVHDADCTETPLPQLDIHARAQRVVDDAGSGSSITIHGWIRNLEPRPAVFPVVNALIFDRDGRLIGYGEGFSSFRTIAPGGTSPLAAEARFFEAPGEKQFRYELLVSAAFEED